MMKLILQLIIIGGALTFLVFGVNLAWSDDDDDDDDSHRRGKGVANVQLPLYTEDCGECHMEYPPGLLPSESWSRVLAGLSDHFGDNAEIDSSSMGQIEKFLQKNSADNSEYIRSKKMMRGISATSNTPLRITTLPYFVRKHDEISASMVKGNDKVRSFANCDACHSKAKQGLFSERNISIPGYASWDD
ncbi:MAG: diheme cytochrome c [Thiohalomonadales bacterium]